MPTIIQSTWELIELSTEFTLPSREKSNEGLNSGQLANRMRHTLMSLRLEKREVKRRAVVILLISQNLLFLL